jgi:pilus assembly protein CpaF
MSEASFRESVSDDYFDLKTKIHDRLLDLLDLSLIDSLDQNLVRSQIRTLVQRVLDEQEHRVPLNLAEKESLFAEIEDEVLGLGPLEPFLKDDTISDILINTYSQIYLERFGKLELSESRFKDDTHLLKIIDKIVSSVGRRIDESSPMVDARLTDGSRVNVIIPPLSIDGPIMSIRRFGRDPLLMNDLILLKSFTKEISEILQGVVKAKLNVLISGGTGSGKTTLLNCMSQYIPEEERIVTIEDAAELQLKQDHLVRLETRPPNIEGKGEVTSRDLVKNSLRMRPDRILMRLESMVAMTNLEISNEFMRRFIASAIDIIIQISRFPDGSRKLISIQEVTGMEGDIITLQEIFSFLQTGVGDDGKVQGHFRFHGVRPRFIDKFVVSGISIPRETFNPDRVFEI